MGISEESIPVPQTKGPSDIDPSAAEISTRIVPSLVLVETKLSTGSGILIPGDLVITTAHVVWPYRTVDLTFSNGVRGTDLDVVAVDWAADLVLIDVGPVEGVPSPALIVPGDPSIGSTVYVIGFPAEDPAGSEPTVTTGIISQTRVWDAADITFLQSDASVSGGQSGGALVDGSGQIVGITTLEVDGGFALSISGSDVVRRISTMLAGDNREDIGDRWLDSLHGVGSHAEHFLDESAWTFNASQGEQVTLRSQSEIPLSGSVIGPDGFLEATLVDGQIQFTPAISGQHIVVVVPEPGADGDTEIAGNVELTEILDPDHGTSLAVGRVVFANADYPGDVDWFILELEAGQTVVISATSPNVDTALYVGPLTDLSGPNSASDSNGGIGVIGADAELRYTAQTAGTYIVAVFDETQFGPGTYAVTVKDG